MMLYFQRSLLVLLQVFTIALADTQAQLNYTGQALTTRYWDCCKPSCGWNGKASVSHPVTSCSADDKPTDVAAGTGCNGGNAYTCSNQQPWAINDTLSYGYAGVFILPQLTKNEIEGAWCCACYRLDFTSDPLRGKSMIVQASNTAYDVKTSNRFSLAIPGGNNTSNTCAQQFGVSESVFGQSSAGVSSRDGCAALPEALRAGCYWRFDWFKDASSSTANFQRVVCPAEISNKTNCVRNDDKILAGVASAAPRLQAYSVIALLAAVALGFTQM